MEQCTVTPVAEETKMDRTQLIPGSLPKHWNLKLPKGVQTRAWSYAHPPMSTLQDKESVIHRGIKDIFRKILEQIWGKYIFWKKNNKWNILYCVKLKLYFKKRKINETDQKSIKQIRFFKNSYLVKLYWNVLKFFNLLKWKGR